MKIIYDARHFEDYISGLSRYSFSVLNDLIKNDKFNSLEIIFNSNYDYSNNPLFINIINMIKDKNKIKVSYLNANIFSLKQNLIVSDYVNKSDCDIYFYPHFDLPLFVKKKSIFVVHDLFPLVLDDYVQNLSFLKKMYFKYMIKLNLIKKNNQCICVSENTKKDISENITNKYDYKLKVIYEDNFDDFSQNQSIGDKIVDLSKNKFLFYVGARRKHKNIKKMIDIFVELKKKNLYDGYFYIAGSEKNFDLDVDKYVKEFSFIKLLGKINDSELMYLYSKMDSLFFLSEYEGFGLPIVEASKLDKKIITSNKGACPEVLPPSGLSIDICLDNKVLTNFIAEYLSSDSKIDNSEFNKQFAWSNTSNYITDQAES